jgi:hypothetical protein
VRQSRPAASDIGTKSKLARLNSLEMAGRAVLGENPDYMSERAPTVSISNKDGNGFAPALFSLAAPRCPKPRPAPGPGRVGSSSVAGAVKPSKTRRRPVLVLRGGPAKFFLLWMSV